VKSVFACMHTITTKQKILQLACESHVRHVSLCRSERATNWY